MPSDVNTDVFYTDADIEDLEYLAVNDDNDSDGDTEEEEPEDKVEEQEKEQNDNNKG